MIFALKTFSKVSLAMLVLLSAAFFVMPAEREVQAQSGVVRPVFICVNTSKANTFERAYVAPGASTGVCDKSPWTLYTGRSNENGLCSGSTPPIQVRKPEGSPAMIFNNDGTKCLFDSGDKDSNNKPIYLEYSFVRFDSIKQQYTPTGTTPTTPTTPTPTTNKNNNNGGGGSTPTTPTPSSAGCETGFHKVGPLCVPNSPFNNGDAITGETTVGGLATRIINILLYFAGIVAVVMCIIGGYQVMTASGNAAQAANGRKTLTNAIIGLVIIILSYIIIQAVISFVT